MPEALADVIAWYEKQMPTAKPDDVNQDSLSIELFKCRGAAHQ
ncbi:MAG TPA: hypothetical protein VN692_18505 [Steroidobacteraceae bacterium]|nr:hypothetical protein [Steroidobacteraceae bacterium]